MDSCNQIRAQTAFYLDDELHNGERDEFEAHLQRCNACQEFCELERQMLNTIRASRPLYSASPDLRARVIQMLNSAPETVTASHRLRERIQGSLWRDSELVFGLRRSRLIMLAVIALALVSSVSWFLTKGRELPLILQPSEFALMAVDTHMRRLRGQLPLEVISDSPQQISLWFAGKVAFRLKLPNYQESSGQEKLYRLEGARLVGFKNDYAAYVAYQMRQRPITLVVTSNSVAMPSGGEQIVSKGLTFHYHSISGLKVITWADHGLTYALVSDLEERGQQSCLVCHEGTKDRDFIEGLKPR